MKHSTDRILTTHVGSLIRPPELQDFLRLVQGGKPYDEKAYNKCLTASVAAVVRQQADAGIDVPSDGEFGKSISWAQYALTRLSGFERRPIKQDTANPFKRGADRTQFADFYAELDCEGSGRHRDRSDLHAGRSNIPARPSCSATSTTSKRAEECEVGRRLPAGGGAGSVIPDRKNEYYKNDAELQQAIADAMRTEYKMIIDAGLLVQLDDARLAVTYDRMVPPATFEDYKRWLAQQVDIINHAIEGHAGRPHSLSRLLGQVARPACLRRAA